MAHPKRKVRRCNKAGPGFRTFGSGTEYARVQVKNHPVGGVGRRRERSVLSVMRRKEFMRQTSGSWSWSGWSECPDVSVGCNLNPELKLVLVAVPVLPAGFFKNGKLFRDTVPVR